MTRIYLQTNWPILFIMLLVSLLCGILTGGDAEASPVDVVKISGSAPVGQELKAIEDAKKRAVFKVFSHDTRAESESDSIFSQMMERYGDYVVSSKVLSRDNSDSRMLVIAEVTVNHNKLKQDFQEKVGIKQEKHDDMTASILMRVVNTTDNQGYGDSLHEAFSHRFSNSGFQTEVEDDDINIVRSLNGAASYGKYLSNVRSLIENNSIMANFAIIGEACIEKLTAAPAGTGYIAKSSVKVQAYDCIRKTVLNGFYETYEILANTPQEAERLAIEKAGLDAAEEMVNGTLKYWRSYK
ncbi:hypothetical protein D081_0307 [Anaerovibrio sp. JC8]|uniref:hypothetical protein n=1 Tax=Anaerovibrio sp. JC8 TaxID=1240085 RepID=UPI000A0C3738|nr:hypothetical protein [Anaerovibrio sp. JC8]ORU01488.1 hypothetical protein D081_0307 [Anaerovibrio sp. JC8]